MHSVTENQNWSSVLMNFNLSRHVAIAVSDSAVPEPALVGPCAET